MTIDPRQFAVGGDPTVMDFGTGNVRYGTVANVFTAGTGNTAGGNQQFIVGLNNSGGITGITRDGDNVFIHGENNQAGYNSGDLPFSSFIQGKDNTVFANQPNIRAWFVQGENNLVRASNTNCRSIFCQGTDNIIGETVGGGGLLYNSAAIFVQGHNNSSNSGGFSTHAIFVQGYGNVWPEMSTPATSLLVQGKNNEVGGPLVGTRYDTHATLVQGADNTVANLGSYWYTLVQGANNTVNGGYSFCQGSYNTLTASWGAAFVQGYGSTVGNYSFAQGYVCSASSDQNFVAGYSCTGQGYNVFIQGKNISITENTGVFGNNLVQGANMTVATSTLPLTEWIIQGEGHLFPATIAGSNTILQGSTHDLTGITVALSSSLIQGSSHTLTDSAMANAFVQGTLHSVSGTRSFAQGMWCSVSRDDQRTWGSNRGVLGAAQFSKIVKWAETTNATTTTVVTLDLAEDKSYFIDVRAVARNTTTDGENARFDYAGLCYRNTLGAAVLNGGNATLLPTAGDGAGDADWELVITQSTNDILVQVTGDALDTVEWLVVVEFGEVLG